MCDINPGRLAYAKSYIGVSCPTFTDLDKMLAETKPDKLIVTTVDATHHEQIVYGLERGVDIITEKPMTTDEIKAQAILDAERSTGRNVIVTFNYRYSPHRARIKELLMANAIGKVTSVDFHWYLDMEHGPRYFRRWHGLRAKGGTLLVHKSTHHFDLLNWWLDSDPAEVVAHGALEFFGKNNSFRSTKCRGCSLAFNGTKGRLEAWIHERQSWPMEDYDELRLTMNFGDTQFIRIPHGSGGHGGGDTRMKDKIFKDPSLSDPLKQSAGTRDGAMSILVGIAARKSIDSGQPVQIASLTDLKPQAKRPE